MKVAIAGATGVLGRALIPRLLKDKHSVVALVRMPQKAVDLFGKKVEAVECDLLAVEADALAELLAGLPPGRVLIERPFGVPGNSGSALSRACGS